MGPGAKITSWEKKIIRHCKVPEFLKCHCKIDIPLYALRFKILLFVIVVNFCREKPLILPKLPRLNRKLTNMACMSAPFSLKTLSPQVPIQSS